MSVLSTEQLLSGIISCSLPPNAGNTTLLYTCGHKTYSSAEMEKAQPFDQWLRKICVAGVRSLSNVTLFPPQNSYIVVTACFLGGNYVMFRQFVGNIL